MNAEIAKPNSCACCGRRLALGETCTLCHIPKIPDDPPLPPTKFGVMYPLTGAEGIILISLLVAKFGAQANSPLSIFLTLTFWLICVLVFSPLEPRKRRHVLVGSLITGFLFTSVTSVMHNDNFTLSAAFLAFFLLGLASLIVQKPRMATLLKVVLIAWSLLIALAPYLFIVR